MPIGPGKYDDLATVARVTARARAVVLILLDGVDGSGFTVQYQAGMQHVAGSALAKLLRTVADEIEHSTKRDAS